MCVCVRVRRTCTNKRYKPIMLKQWANSCEPYTTKKKGRKMLHEILTFKCAPTWSHSIALFRQFFKQMDDAIELNLLCSRKQRGLTSISIERWQCLHRCAGAFDKLSICNCFTERREKNRRFCTIPTYEMSSTNERVCVCFFTSLLLFLSLSICLCVCMCARARVFFFFFFAVCDVPRKKFPRRNKFRMHLMALAHNKHVKSETRNERNDKCMH